MARMTAEKAETRVRKMPRVWIWPPKGHPTEIGFKISEGLEFARNLLLAVDIQTKRKFNSPHVRGRFVLETPAEAESVRAVLEHWFRVVA
jgi:hypothetical protein